MICSAGWQPRIAAATLAGAGSFLLTPRKRHCQTACRSRLGFIREPYACGANNAFQISWPIKSIHQGRVRILARAKLIPGATLGQTPGIRW